jgi:hypothetical protein
MILKCIKIIEKSLFLGREKRAYSLTKRSKPEKEKLLFLRFDVIKMQGKAFFI